MAEEKSLEVNMAVMASDLQYIKKETEEIKSLLASKYVTVEAFEPIRKLVYGMVSLILVAVVGAILTIVIRK
jgi:hypothetical protein